MRFVILWTLIKEHIIFNEYLVENSYITRKNTILKLYLESRIPTIIEKQFLIP